MKYGILFCSETDNIGDDIQTYAAKRFLPSIDYVIERENMRKFVPNKKEYVKVILNGWFLHNKISWPPSPYIKPLLISMHFTENNDIDVGDIYIKQDIYLNDKIIGCRDQETINRLQKYNKKSFFSGCLTLTLEKFPNIEKGNDILVIDIDSKIKDKLDFLNIKYIEKYNFRDQKEMKKKTFDQRMLDVEALLKTFQKAKVVFTSRLHVLLPCLALGVRVILILPRDYEKDRVESYLRYAEHYYIDEFLNADINIIINNTIKYKTDSIRVIRKNLISKCNKFIRDTVLCAGELPEIEEYEKYSILFDYDLKMYEILKNKIVEIKKTYINKINDETKKSLEIGDAKLDLLSQNELLKKRLEVPLKINNQIDWNNVILIKSITKNEKTITCDYVATGRSKKYFRNCENVFFDCNINVEDLPDYIAIIPFVVNILPVAWITHSDIYIDSIDRNFLKFISKTINTCRLAFPNDDLNENLYAKEVKKNKTKNFELTWDKFLLKYEGAEIIKDKKYLNLLNAVLGNYYE